MSRLKQARRKDTIVVLSIVLLAFILQVIGTAIPSFGDVLRASADLLLPY